MEKIKTTELSITALKYEAVDEWLKSYGEKNGFGIDKHPLYLALKGDFMTLHEWCNSRQDIWTMERLDLLFDVYRSLIRYGQLEPIVVKNGVIVTGHKRACCLLIMGRDKIKVELKS